MNHNDALPEQQCVVLIGPLGQVAKLYCPFIAFCLNDVGSLKQHTFVKVQAIRTTTEGRLVFIVNGQHYYHHNFRVLIELC
jgi:hypothetical protein